METEVPKTKRTDIPRENLYIKFLITILIIVELQEQLRLNRSLGYTIKF